MIKKRILPAALGLWISAAGAGTLCGQEVQKDATATAKTTAAAQSNQSVADAIAASLKQSGVVRGYRVDIVFSGGVAELSGRVQNPSQREAVVRIVHSVHGVKDVRDHLMVMENGGVRPVQAQVPPAQVPQIQQAPPQLEIPPPPALQQVPPPPNGIQEPLSIMPPGMGPMGVNPQMQPPPMPPYAWPTYAPYNNFSRVAYPQLYPYESFPFIGPMYPYPKVPPGWRAITLRWQDGYWWYGKEATGHDWWRVRYW